MIANAACATISSTSAPEYAQSAPRRAISLRVNSDLLRIARKLGINLSHELETRLAEIVTEKRQQRWLTENQAAIDACNQHIERDGAFGGRLRTF